MSKPASTVSAERLKSFIQRIERLNQDRAAVGSDLQEVYSEAKSAGFDTKIIRKIVTLRQKEIEKRREEAELMDLYLAAIGDET